MRELYTAGGCDHVVQYVMVRPALPAIVARIPKPEDIQRGFSNLPRLYSGLRELEEPNQETKTEGGPPTTYLSSKTILSR